MKAGERRPPPTPTTSAARAPAPARTTPEPVDPTSPPGPPFLSSYLLFHWPGLHLLCTTIFTSRGHCNDVDGLKRQRPGFPQFRSLGVQSRSPSRVGSRRRLRGESAPSLSSPSWWRSTASGVPQLVDTSFQSLPHGHVAFPLCVSMGLRFSLSRCVSLDLGLAPRSGQAHLKILPLITSEKTLFPDEVAFTATGVKDLDLYFRRLLFDSQRPPKPGSSRLPTALSR